MAWSAALLRRLFARRKPTPVLPATPPPRPVFKAEPVPPAGRLAGDKIQRGVLAVAIVLLVSMIVVAVLLALASRNGGAGVTAFVLFAAAAAVGAGLGFLFGLPRARVADLAGDGSATNAAPTSTTKASTYYLTNSNLIKVSDWLTAGASDLELVLPPNTSDDATVIAQTLPPGTSVPRGTGLTVTMLAPPTAPGGAG
jgi:hypothetical protein